MYSNNLTQLSPGMFSGLQSLEWLCLNDNNISHIEAGTFEKLSKLRTLLLKNNLLITLVEDAFQTSPDTKLTISLIGNSFQCDSRVYWIKQAEQKGWITWYQRSITSKQEKPVCVNYPGVDWDNVTLAHTSKIPFL